MARIDPCGLYTHEDLAAIFKVSKDRVVDALSITHVFGKVFLGEDVLTAYRAVRDAKAAAKTATPRPQKRSTKIALGEVRGHGNKKQKQKNRDGDD